MKCECEHSSHFGRVSDHPYDEPQPRRGTRAVKTVLGTFALCKDCIDKGHMGVR